MHGHWLKDYIGPKASANSGGGGTEPLIVSLDRVEREDVPIPVNVAYYDKTWQEISDALTANRPVYIKYGDFNTDGDYIENGSSLVPIFMVRTEPAPNGETVYIAVALSLATDDVKTREFYASGGADAQISYGSGSTPA